MKAIAINTIFMIITTVMFLFVGIVIIFGFLNIAGLEATSTTCSIKLLNYCASWVVKGFAESDKPYKWNEKSPNECSKFLEGVDDSTGPGKDKCKIIVK